MPCSIVILESGLSAGVDLSSKQATNNETESNSKSHLKFFISKNRLSCYTLFGSGKSNGKSGNSDRM